MVNFNEQFRYNIICVDKLCIIEINQYYGNCTSIFSKGIITVNCQCHKTRYYHIILQQSDPQDISHVSINSTYRSPCLKTATFYANAHQTYYYIIVFLENTEYGIIGNEVFFAQQLSASLITTNNGEMGINYYKIYFGKCCETILFS